MPKKEQSIKHATYYSAYLLIIWGLYRYLFKLPDDVEELLVKPILWLVPLVYLLNKERSGFASLGFSSKNLYTSLYFVLGLGVVFVLEGLVINLVKYGGFNFSANVGNQAIVVSLGLSLATAFSEEVAFRGYLFNRVWHSLGNEWLANVIVAGVWALVHVPVTIFIWRGSPFQIGTYLFLAALFSVGSSFVFARTKNVIPSIILHVLWEWPIILFR